MTQVVVAPSGLMTPVGVATVLPTLTAAPVTTAAGGGPVGGNGRSAPATAPAGGVARVEAVVVRRAQRQPGDGDADRARLGARLDLVQCGRGAVGGGRTVREVVLGAVPIGIDRAVEHRRRVTHLGGGAGGDRWRARRRCDSGERQPHGRAQDKHLQNAPHSCLLAGNCAFYTVAQSEVARKRGKGVAVDSLSAVIFYEPDERDRTVLAHDPFKALVAPRPIGW